MPLPLVGYPLLLSLAAALLQDRAARRRALGGAVLATLAAASLAVVGEGDWRGAGLPASYLATTAALLLLAGGATVLAGGRGWTDRLLSSVALGMALLSGGTVAWPLLLAGGVARSVAALGVIAAGLLAGLLLLRALIEPAMLRLDLWLTRRMDTKPPATRPSIPLLIAHLGLALLALSVSHLHLLFAVVFCSLIAGWLFERGAQGAVRWPVGVLVGAIGLLASWWLLASVAGDTSLAFSALPDAPYSASFEVMLTPVLLLAVWPLLHLAPFHGARQGPAAPLLGALLLFRLCPTALSGGMLHWQPMLFLLLILAAFAAVVRRRDAALLTVLGVAGIVSLEPPAGWAGLGLVTLACVLAGARRILATGFRLSGIGEWLARLLPVAGVALLLPCLTGMLGVEVVYSVAMVLVVLMAVGR